MNDMMLLVVVLIGVLFGVVRLMFVWNVIVCDSGWMCLLKNELMCVYLIGIVNVVVLSGELLSV